MDTNRLALEILSLTEEFEATLTETELDEGLRDLWTKMKDFGKEKLKKLLDYVKAAANRLKLMVTAALRFLNPLSSLDDLEETLQEAVSELGSFESAIGGMEEVDPKAQKAAENWISQMNSDSEKVDRGLTKAIGMRDQLEEAADDGEEALKVYKQEWGRIDAQSLMSTMGESSRTRRKNSSANAMIEAAMMAPSVDNLVEGWFSNMAKGVGIGVRKVFAVAKMIAKAILNFVAGVVILAIGRDIGLLYGFVNMVYQAVEGFWDGYYKVFSMAYNLAEQRILAIIRAWEEMKDTLKKLNAEAETFTAQMERAKSPEDSAMASAPAV